MADVKRTCVKCGASVLVSSVAERFVCPSCGNSVSLAPLAQSKEKKDAETQKKPAIRIKDEQYFETTNKTESESGGFFSRKRREKPIPTRPKASKALPSYLSPHYIASWVLFFVIGISMAGCRYLGWLSEDNLEKLRLISPVILLVLYLLILVSAFADSVFSGILSLLFPPYSIYYLFAVSDRFFLRAIVLGLFVGIGDYSIVFLTHHWTRIVTMIHQYIASGG